MRNGDSGNRAEMPDYSSGERGRNPQGPVVGASNLTAKRDDSCRKIQKLMEAVVERENMFRALRQVEANKGSSGVDGLPVQALRDHLRKRYAQVSEFAHPSHVVAGFCFALGCVGDGIQVHKFLWRQSLLPEDALKDGVGLVQGHVKAHSESFGEVLQGIQDPLLVDQWVYANQDDRIVHAEDFLVNQLTYAQRPVLLHRFLCISGLLVSTRLLS